MNSAADWGEEDERELEAAMQGRMQAVREQMAHSCKCLNEDEILQMEECGNEKMAQLIEERNTEREISHLGRRIYHEAPDDIMEQVVSRFNDADGKRMSTECRGGLNVLRLVSRRMKQLVETSSTTWLTNTREEDGPESLPLDLLSRCRRIEHIKCYSHNFRSLEGCPDRLKTLFVGHGHHIESLEPLRGCIQLEGLRIRNAAQISDLSPLAGCTRMKYLIISLCRITDLTFLTSMPLLQSVVFLRLPTFPSIKDISPIFNIISLSIGGNTELKDMSLLTCLVRLALLDISFIPTDDLAPLASLQNLKSLICNLIPTTTSLLPLERCRSLCEIQCDSNAKDLALLEERRLDIEFEITQIQHQPPVLLQA